ncbi:hypothetical protein ACET3Z_013942 [Daucus carota]
MHVFTHCTARLFHIGGSYLGFVQFAAPSDGQYNDIDEAIPQCELRLVVVNVVKETIFYLISLVTPLKSSRKLTGSTIGVLIIKKGSTEDGVNNQF